MVRSFQFNQDTWTAASRYLLVPKEHLPPSLLTFDFFFVAFIETILWSTLNDDAKDIKYWFKISLPVILRSAWKSKYQNDYHL